MKKMLGCVGGDAGTHLAWFLGQWDGSAVGLQIGSWDSRGGPCLLAVLVLFLFRCEADYAWMGGGFSTSGAYLGIEETQDVHPPLTQTVTQNGMRARGLGRWQDC